MDSTFEEKSTWITFGGLVVVFGFYCYVAVQLLSAGVTEMVAPFIPVFGVTVIGLVVILVAGHLIAAVAKRPEARDERDAAIERRAESMSSWILGVGVLAAVFILALPVGRAWIANGLLVTLFLSEIVNYALRLFYYRRGM